MIWTKIKRVLRSGFINFWRNGFVSAASILIMTVTLFVMGSLLFLDAMLDASLDQIRDKVDVNVYFVSDAQEDDVLAIKEDLEALPEVAYVEYVSKEDAISRFRERHQDDQLILQALQELGDNPLGAYLNVKAQEPSQYESIANFLEDENALTPGEGQIIDKVNYFQNKVAIDRLTGLTDSISTLSVLVMIVFFIISILIIFNTVRLAIYTAREEIHVMKLVGASDRYIRSPFIVEGVMYGMVAALIALILFYPITLWVGPFTESFFGATNLFDYYVDNFLQLFVILIITGAILGALSSYLAVRKYLKV